MLVSLGASLCAFAFAFAAFDFAFAAFARAFVTSALLSAHFLLSCSRVVFCLSFCRTSKCNACVCPACSSHNCAGSHGCFQQLRVVSTKWLLRLEKGCQSLRWLECMKSSDLSQPTYALRFALDAQWQPGGVLASTCTASCWNVGISTGVRYHKKADRAPVRSTSPTRPPKSRGASRWTSHTASPSISPSYARSSQSNTGTARPAQSSARSSMWSVCSYHNGSGCDPSNAGDPWAPGLYSDFQNAALQVRPSDLLHWVKGLHLSPYVEKAAWFSQSEVSSGEGAGSASSRPSQTCLKIFTRKQKQSWRGLSVLSEACDWDYTCLASGTSSSGNAQGCA